MKKKVLISLLGPKLDMGTAERRWDKWRPSVAVAQHEDLLFDRYEMIYQENYEKLRATLEEDIHSVSPETELNFHTVDYRDPWDFQQVYSEFYDFARNYDFKDDEEYFVHITTGTHVAQICLFILTESRHFPAKLIQTSPPRGRKPQYEGSYTIIDLDLSKYDGLASRFKKERLESRDLLKSGIQTRDEGFNQLIAKIEKVANRSTAPLLLTGPTGAGKSQLASRIYELKEQKRQVLGAFVTVNCATLRGDMAMSTLFGHKKGAFTGAQIERKGLLKEADGGLLFLDEIGELGLDEQAMLLRALEDKTFLPVGSDKEESSQFQLICGTNRDLYEQVLQGTFREDLFARINTWSFELPGLKDRRADIEPNIDYELEKFSDEEGRVPRFNQEARQRFLSFATAGSSAWRGNFRDLNASIQRLCTLADHGRIGEPLVNEEIGYLESNWQRWELGDEEKFAYLGKYLTPEQVMEIDPFDKPQLNEVLRVCSESSSLSEAGRKLFAVSRAKKKSSNDSDRLRKYLAKFGLTPFAGNSD